jgi:hypothetical protein
MTAAGLPLVKHIACLALLTVTSIASGGAMAMSVLKAPPCKPVMVSGKCMNATARYSILSDADGTTRDVTLLSITPDGMIRPWAECVAGKWRKFDMFLVPSPPGTRVVEITFDSNGCGAARP